MKYQDAEWECGCFAEVKMEKAKSKSYPVWFVTSFCEEHEPTVNN